MSKDIAHASAGVMAGIAEALIATAVGLLVAIPAVIAYNVFKGMVKDATTNTESLTRVLMAELKSANKTP
jgi:biopolymer transport protein ExbB